MELKDCVLGQRVQVKEEHIRGLFFCSRFRGEYGTITTEPDNDGDVGVVFDRGGDDVGHHTNLRKIKE